MSEEATPYRVLRYRDDRPAEPAHEEVAREAPLIIRLAGRDVGVTMRTPGHDAELIPGFLFGEGVIARRADVRAIHPCDAAAGDCLDVTLAPGVPVDFARLSRHVFASSSCGICGSVSIERLRARVSRAGDGPRLDPAVIHALPGSLRSAQPTFDRTGGLHAAALFDADSRRLVVREDIGRHNAVDKVVGHALWSEMLPLVRHILLVSGRASFEIVQKAACAGIPVVAAVSAPSSLAIDLARDLNMTLIGFLRDGRFTVYAGAERLRASQGRAAGITDPAAHADRPPG